MTTPTTTAPTRRTPYQIVCHRCNKLLRTAAGRDMVADIYGDQDGEDVCKECHDKHVEPFLIIEEDGNLVGFHKRDCGMVEVAYIDPQPERVNDTWWLYDLRIFTVADMQNHLLAEADLEREGGPVLIDGFWYWSPVFDEDEYGEGNGLWEL